MTQDLPQLIENIITTNRKSWKGKAGKILIFLVPLSAVVLAGGFIGSKSGAFKFDHHKIIIIIAAVVAVAGIELTIKLLA
jgi:hypothetical protein